MALRQTIKTEHATAVYSDGRGSYDYEAIAKILEPDPELIERHSRVSVDWRKVCEEAGMTEELKEKFYRPGKPYVSLKIANGEK